MPTNPFESDAVENFPPFVHLFENSPSIDTIARTKPVDFSLHSSLQSSARSARHVGLTERSPRDDSRPRVAKQLNFRDAQTSSGGPKFATRAMAAAAGWPTHAISLPTGSSSGGRGGSDARAHTSEPSASAPSETEQAATAVATGGAVPQGEVVEEEAAAEDAALPSPMAPAASAAQPAAHAAAYSPLPRPRSLAAPQMRAPPSMQPSPSAPALPTRSALAADGHSGGAGSKAAGAGRRLSEEKLDEVRRALLEPASFEFSQYLRSLWRRWPQRPLVRSRMSELGLSPVKAKAGTHHLDGEAAVDAPPTRFWEPPPEAHRAPHPPLSNAYPPPMAAWQLPYPMPVMMMVPMPATAAAAVPPPASSSWSPLRSPVPVHHHPYPYPMPMMMAAAPPPVGYHHHHPYYYPPFSTASSRSMFK